MVQGAVGAPRLQCCLGIRGGDKVQGVGRAPEVHGELFCDLDCAIKIGLPLSDRKSVALCNQSTSLVTAVEEHGRRITIMILNATLYFCKLLCELKQLFFVLFLAFHKRQVIIKTL